jgi:hypothetical protein
MDYKILPCGLSSRKDSRIRQYISCLIDKYSLNLRDRIIFTEYATGNYYYTAVMAKMAGAEEVYAYSPLSFSQPCLSQDGIIQTSIRDFIRAADIITNSGNVRPITRLDIDIMKPSAVIALMMMKSQVRDGDVDLLYCDKRQIRFVETDEAGIGILDSIGFKIMKVCFEAGLSVWRDRFFLLSSRLIGFKTRKFFEKMGVHISISLVDDFYDAIILSDYSNDIDASLLKEWIQRLAKINPLIRVIWISGELDESWCLQKGIDIYPLMSKLVGGLRKTNVSGDYLSYKVTLELNVASLKAAEIALDNRGEISNKNK